ncbi:putative HTH-type transcriptional regulator [BD1-7 clade bacterium]|uniref:Putative HTH-type transcriptional regulator n=1 Tax=BD1-7 clade bacterium TaxID=2029982 RepID=A0A5S9QV79_9GAMM|nr:putative HTH-type transcriptional regulator [BD1-7 clade bacterium]CAA0122917.1 putative HTH-type transcriptional regulator [BD1-7 clade bacterium]
MYDEDKVDIRENGISTRINEIASAVGGKKQLAKMTGVSESQLHRYVSDDHDLKLTVLLAMAEAGGVNLLWLATGEGPRSMDDSGVVAVPKDELAEFALIPGYDIQVSAGHGAFPDSEQPTRRLAFRHRWLKFRGLSENDLVLVYASGDSMEPTISNNNTLMVDTSDTKLLDGSVYVIRHDGHLLVKRTQYAPGQGVWLISDNKQYEKLLVNIDETPDMEVVGRVVWIGRDM